MVQSHQPSVDISIPVVWEKGGVGAIQWEVVRDSGVALSPNYIAISFEAWA
jgi:hypothetical protein